MVTNFITNRRNERIKISKNINECSFNNSIKSYKLVTKLFFYCLFTMTYRVKGIIEWE